MGKELDNESLWEGFADKALGGDDYMWIEITNSFDHKCDEGVAIDNIDVEHLDIDLSEVALEEYQCEFSNWFQCEFLHAADGLAVLAKHIDQHKEQLLCAKFDAAMTGV